MADTITECDLELLFATMESTIAAAFPALQRVKFDEPDRDNLPTPCCMLDCDQMDSGAMDPGTEQAAMTARFAARFIIGFRTPKAKLEAAKMAGAFAAFLRKQLRWPPAKSGAVDAISCYRDEFDPRLDQFEVWCVEWTHVLHFGQSVWEADGITPSQVFLGFVPEVGAGNEPKYIEITGL